MIVEMKIYFWLYFSNNPSLYFETILILLIRLFHLRKVWLFVFKLPTLITMNMENYFPIILSSPTITLI